MGMLVWIWLAVLIMALLEGIAIWAAWELETEAVSTGIVRARRRIEEETG